VVAIASASASGKTPTSIDTPQTHDACCSDGDRTSSTGSSAEPAGQGFKILASSLAERFLKLMGLIAKKFRKIKGVDQFARSALPALLKLLKLPTARPLARLCHKLHLVEHLSELAASVEVGQSATGASPCSLGGFPAAYLRRDVRQDEDDGNAGEEDEDEEIEIQVDKNADDGNDEDDENGEDDEENGEDDEENGEDEESGEVEENNEDEENGGNRDVDGEAHVSASTAFGPI
jgi:hypothetical protein